MAELKATKTVAPFGTAMARGVPAAMVVSCVATRGRSRRQRIEAHRLEHVAGEQLVVVVARRLLRARQRVRTTQQLLDRLRHHHRRLRRPADDEAHQRRGSGRRRSRVPAACMARQRPSTSSWVCPDAAGASVHEALDVRTQARGQTSTSARSAGSCPIDELEFEQPGRPDAQVFAGRIRYAEIAIAPRT